MARLAPPPAAAEDATSSVAGSRRLPSTRPTSPPASATAKHQTAKSARSTGVHVCARSADKTAAILVRDGAALRPPGGRARRRARRRSARRADAAADARRVRGAGAPPRGRLRAARRARVRAAALDDPLRAARHRQDDARAARRRARRRGLRGGLGGQRRSRRGPRRHRPSAGAARWSARPRDDLLPRRDPPLQQGAAGRAAARGRGRARHADRRDDREPVLRGQLRAALARPGLRAALARRRRCRGAAAARARPRRGRGPGGPRRGAHVPRRPRRRRRAHGPQRARAGRRHRAPRPGAARHARRRRGLPPAQGRPLRQGRRPALRLHLGVDQVHARLGPRRLAVLPGRDDRGRRGPALHRPADDRARLRGRRQRRPARARGRRRGRPRRRARRAARGGVRALAVRHLSLARAEVRRRQAGDGRCPPPHPRGGRQAAARAAAFGRLPGGAEDGPRQGLRLPARPPGPRQRPGAPARGRGGPALLLPGRGRARGARPPGGDPPGARPRVVSASTPQDLWALVPAAGRARYLRRTATAILDELDGLAAALAETVGQPRTEAVLAELLPSVGGLHDLADHGPRALRDRRLGRIPALRAGRRSVLVQAPRGTVAVRGGTASPWAEPVLETGAALLAGNEVVLSTPMGERVRAAFERGGVAPDLIRLVAPGEDVRALAPHVVDARPPREKGALLVLDGAPLDRTATGAVWAAFAAGGRHPTAVGRLVVVPSVAEPLIAAVVAAAQRLRPGDPRRPETEVGPLRSPQTRARVEALVTAAVEDGATLECGGPLEVAGVPGAFYAPTVLRGVRPGARLLHEPVPGPVLAVIEAAGEEEAVAPAPGAPARSGGGGDPPPGGRGGRPLRGQGAWGNKHGPA